jgi:hypothetical protein
MYRLTLALILILTALPLVAEVPTVNLPKPLRQANWIGVEGEGSCVHATITSLFRWQSEEEWAEYWKAAYSDGETVYGLNEKLTKDGVPFKYTYGRRDVKFLEDCIRERRGCGIALQRGRHMVALVYLDDQWAGILDNNQTDRFLWVKRDALIQEWIGANSWAVTPTFTPVPPLPKR